MVLDLFMNIKIRKDMNFWFYDENKKELKNKFIRKLKNADQEIFRNFVRIYLHTSPPLDDLWLYNEYGDEFPIGKIAFTGQYLKEKLTLMMSFN